MSERNKLTEKNLLRFWFAPDKNKMIIHLYNKSILELEKNNPLIEDLRKLQHSNSFKNLLGKWVNKKQIKEIKVEINLMKPAKRCNIKIFMINGEFFEIKNQALKVLDEIKHLK